jgi:small subunit ribosomal protein S6
MSAVYETTFILRPDSTDDDQKNISEKVKTIIQNHEGQVMGQEDWGRRRFAYPINKENRGQYLYFYYRGNNSLVAELERNLRINEKVIRFLTVSIAKEFDEKIHKYKPSVNVAVEERREVQNG